MDDRITKTLDHIEANLHLQLTLEDLAEVACLSPSQFHRIFKKETKRTPFIFIEEMKMAKAYDLICEGKIMVHEMAFHLGYKDYETFTRAFKKHFFVSPDDFKSIARRIKDELNDEELLFVTVENDDDDETILKKLETIMEEKGLPIHLLDHSRAIKIIEKTGASNPEQLIKNKFEITSGSKIWKSLMNSDR